ncbi:MAG: type I polyketide synthase [Steroidobacteraceae bacterium]
MLSPDGHCRTFDHRSKGTIFGSGAGVVVLRRLADAIADGDHIHAIIKASAVNNDGSSKVGYLAPSVDGQAAAVAEAIALSGVDADTIGYIECHGTATPVGDPIEIAALTQAFRQSTEKAGFCYVGSVKTNIGHLDTAAGVAGMIKAALALEHGRIPPSLNYEAPNPTIGFDGSPFKVADKLIEWPAGPAPRRAAVNSLGVGGTNAFVVLQQPPAPKPLPPAAPAQPLVLSARNRRALDDAAAQLAKWLRANTHVPLADVAWTLMQGRHGFEQRRVLAAASHEEAAQLLENGDARRVFNHALELDRPSLVFMCPGGGAQYFQMGRGLHASEPVFREQMERGFKLLRERHKVDLAPVFLAEPAARDATIVELNKPSVQLPLIFLIGHALTKLWEHYGVTPSAVVGHSMGENTAACVAGVFSFEDALGLVLLRGQLMDEVPEGAMLSVSMPAAELKPLLGTELDLATSNSPQLSVASGPAPLIDQLAARLAEKGIDSQRVRINIAAHSRMLDGILGRFRDYLRSIKLGEPKLPIVSNRTGQWLPPARARDPEYWVEHLRNTVLFAANVDTLLESDDRVFLEVGPGNILGSFVRQNPKAPAQRVFSSLRHPDDASGDDVYLRAVTARLWAVGVPVKLEALWTAPRRRVPMPTYPFQHQSYWIAPGTSAVHAAPTDERPMRLAELDDWFRTPRWVQQGVLETRETPATWLVFQTREPVADGLVERLRSRGDTVVTVLSGDTFTRVDDHTFTIAPEAGGVGYGELIEALGESNLLPDFVLHTWLLTWDQSFRPGSTFLHRNQEYGFYSLFHLAQALGKAGVLEKPIQIIVAGSGLLRVADEAAPYPDKATALGPVAVIPREFPNIQCRFVDVSLPLVDAKRRKAPPTRDPGAALAALEAEIGAVPGSGVFAWRDGVRWQRHVSKWPATQRGDGEPRLRQQGVYVITGGLGGIAGVLAEWLAREYRAKLVLLARTPLPQRSDWNDWIAQNGADDSISRSIERIRQLEALGAQVLPVAADVTVAERMHEVVSEVQAAFGAVNGVFHAAGVIRDNLIQLKSQRDIEEVFSAKVWGTLVLDEVFAKSPLDFMLLFSSTSSFIAPQGQVDYVGANSFLNAFADARRGERPYPVIALNWGVWKGVGMVGTGAAGDAQSLEIDRGSATAHEPKHPWFARHLSARDGVDSVHWFEGSFSAEADWVIDEHRLSNGEALLPAQVTSRLIRTSVCEIGAGAQVGRSATCCSRTAVRLTARRAAAGFRLRLKDDDRRWRWMCSRVPGASDGQDDGRFAPARVARARPRHRPCSRRGIEARCTVRQQVIAGGTGFLRSRQEDHLRFGPRFRPLKKLSLGTSRRWPHLQLPAGLRLQTSSSSGLHPGLLDIATGCAMDLIRVTRGTGGWRAVPAPLGRRSYAACCCHAPLTAEVTSWLRLSPSSPPQAGTSSRSTS